MINLSLLCYDLTSGRVSEKYDLIIIFSYIIQQDDRKLSIIRDVS